MKLVWGPIEVTKQTKFRRFFQISLAVIEKGTIFSHSLVSLEKKSRIFFL